MTTSLIDADSMLVIDVGAVSTRAMLFDVVDGRYRFLAVGSAPSTDAAPFYDVGEGVQRAIENLQEITGRVIIDENERLIIPATRDGRGVDTFAATISAGPPLKVVAVGLLEDVSLESTRRLAKTTYTGVIETISLNDRRKSDARIDSILRLRPDLILVAGGTDGGASQSVLKLLEAVGLACYLTADEQKPEVIYAGNQELTEEVRSSLTGFASLHFAPNIRPMLEMENLDAAQTVVAEASARVRARQIAGVRNLDEWAGGGLLPTASAFGRLIRFLSRAYDSPKGVLGVDVGASATTIAAAFHGDLTLGVYPEYGLGRGLPGLLEDARLEEIAQWLPQNVPLEDIHDYIYNKSLFPGTLPATKEELAIEQALARQVMRCGLRRAAGGFPASVSRRGLLPPMAPILASGSVLTHAPTLGSCLMMMLDGLQPVGVTTMVLDQNHLAAALGAAAAINPILSVQVLDSSTFVYLGTVISPVGNARPGTPILRLRMVQSNGNETTIDIKYGTLEAIPLPLGQSARVHLQPFHRFDVGMGGPGRSGSLVVHGGALGVVIDARGRPLRMPKDVGRRQEAMQKWLWTLGG
ncbi:MAG: hypothetical protein GX495_09835 [Chloroflexi bacterium]|nr:hypothetical protein [Chloroflexota bacterium]